MKKKFGKKISIVGESNNGIIIKSFLNPHHNVKFCDPVCTYIGGSEITFICVNEKEVEETVKLVNTDLIVLVTTVPPGTTDYLSKKYNKNIVFCPVYNDYYIFGGTQENTSKIVPVYQKCGGSSKKYIQTDSKSAETSVYLLNKWLNTKLSFFQQLNEICKVNGSDYNKLRELVLKDPRINNSNTLLLNNQDFSKKI